MSGLAGFARSQCLYHAGRARAYAATWLDRRRDPAAAAFYSELLTRGCAPNTHIDVLPRHRIVYLCIPKCASTTIKMALSALAGRTPASFEQIHQRRHSGLKSPFEIGLSNFRALALDRATLRFAFVRNPYDRLVSAWADKFQNKSLVPGDDFVDKYLGYRDAADPALPSGAGEMLSFAGFVRFAAATAQARLDPHWHCQDDMLDMPGITLDFIGKVESFEADFARVMEHVGAGAALREAISTRLNPSRHLPWRDYYTRGLADQVYRAYERDFDRLGYPRAI
jgi:hypothetical protein